MISSTMQRHLHVSILLFLIATFAFAFESRVHSNQLCQQDADCEANSFCFGNDVNKKGNCKCIEGFILFDNITMYECSKPVEGVGSLCTFDDQCELVLGVDSECDEKNKCRCLPSAHLVSEKNSCYKTSQPNENCTSNENCFPLGQFQCSFGKCSCPLNHHLTSDNRCVESLHLGDLCKLDESCIHMNAVCRVNCQCRLGYVVADNEHNCLTAATTLGEPCQQLSQCDTYLKNSVCLQGKCNCKEDFHKYGNSCFKSRSVGEQCGSKQECVLHDKLENLVECESNVCTCKYGSRIKDDCVERSATDFIRNTNVYLLAAILFMVL